MGFYQDAILKIRDARKQRDTAKDQLYSLQVKHIALKKAQKKFTVKDIKVTEQTTRPIEEKRKQLAELQDKLRKVIHPLTQLQQLERQLEDNMSLLEKLEAEKNSIEKMLQTIAEQLNDPQLTSEQRNQLTEVARQLPGQVAALQKRTEGLRSAIATLRQQIDAAQQRKRQLEEDRKGIETRIAQTTEELKVLVRNNNDQPADTGSDIGGNRGKIREQADTVKKASATLAASIADLFAQRTPQDLIQEWNDGIPIMLFPIRVETKFKVDGGPRELWVRVFPDEIEIATHEKVLTQIEVDFGVAYWKGLWNAKGDENKKKIAWRMVAEKFGANRAAWVVLQNKPGNWEGADLLMSENDLVFPVIDQVKPDSWSEAPHTRVLPDRFVFLGYNNGELQHTSIGAAIPDVLVVGPAPLEDEDQPSITRNETDNRLQYGEELKWLFEFDTAIRNGMAIRIPLNDAQAENGFDQLLVLGIKISADDTDGKQLLEDLIHNHHYSKKGISLVTQGTPTNNTEEQSAGFSTSDPLQNTSFVVEAGDRLFVATNTKGEATDGQRLAEYLGIAYESVDHVLNSNAYDCREAVAMNHALYAGTMGFFLHSMLNEVMDDSAIAKLRYHFNNHVTGRGPLSAIRVGKQPYGILPTSAFRKWTYRANPDTGLGVAVPVIRDDNFYVVMHRFLVYLEQQWELLRPQLSHISKQGDAGANLMSVLGLHPTSVEFFQRVGYTIDTLRNLEGFLDGGKYIWDQMVAGWNKIIVPLILKQFGYNRKSDNGTDKPVPLLLQLIFRHYHTRLDPKNLIDGEPLSEELGIKPYDEPRDLNYIHWLLEQTTAKQLQDEDFGGAPKPTSLLYMMLRHSLLLETNQSIYNFLIKNKIEALELIRSRKFANITNAPTVSHWEVFDAPANKVVKNEGSAKGLFELMHSPRFDAPADSDVVKNLKEQKQALDVLKTMKTARLERTLAEHLDTLTYRLDSWQTSLFDLRLRAQRNLDGDTVNRKTGIYLGAYGYLENVKPARNRRSRIPEDVLPLPLREDKENLFMEPANAGYVHAPSLNHATAAAILRNGYLTHSSSTERELLNVNLSSERVRRALYLIEGLRNGQTLEVLLGYQFERGLHEWSTRAVDPVVLNDLIPAFRSAFPIKKTKVPQEGKTTGPEETINDYHVVNGMDLARATTASPYITVSPALSNPKIDAIRREKENIQNTLDAMRDLLTSESAYQLALGNFDRAAAVLQSVSNSQIPPEIEVINTARGTNLSFTNRVAIQFDPGMFSNPWSPVSMTMRATTEAGINNWVGTLLGSPLAIRCWVKAVDDKGVILKRSDDTNIEGVVDLQQLGVQPIDLMYLIRNKLEESGTSEVEARVRYVFARANALSDATIIKIEFNNSGSPGDLAVRSFAEILPFTNYIRETISSSRPLGARDYEIASKKVINPGDNPNNINVPELISRVGVVFTGFTGLFTQLETSVTDAESLKTEVAVDELRNKLIAVANAGYVFAFPQSSNGFAQEQIDILVAQSKSLLKRFDQVKTTYNDNLAIVNNVNTKPPEKISLLTQMVKSMLGDDFVIMPRFSFTNVTEVTTSYDNRAGLLTYAKDTLNMALPTDEWLHGVSMVRPKMHVFEMLRLLNDSFNSSLLVIEPMQLPYRTNDSWLAIEFPDGTTVDHDTLSFILHSPQGFDPAGEQCGLLVDDWTESVPNKEEVTGIAFNYNQPNSVPPQAILLCVTPQETGSWKWVDLADSVLDTFRRAKLRAVEPDLIDAQGGITTLFPAIISEFSTGKSNISLDYTLNIHYVAQAVAAMTTTTDTN